MKTAELTGAQMNKKEKCRLAATKHAKRYSRIYNIWTRMKDRCLNPNSDRWQWYGGKGITVCDRWTNSFQNFLADMGECPHGMSIDRIDSAKNYEPSNCRWATVREQNRNRSSTVMIEFNGRSMCLKDWAEDVGVPYGTMWARYKAGWSVQRMLTTGVDKKKSEAAMRSYVASKFGDEVPDETRA